MRVLIRRYVPRTDQGVLMKLIQAELLPLSHVLRTQDAQAMREVPARLRSGCTFVALVTARSRSLTARPVGFVHVRTSGDQLLVDLLAVQGEHQGKKIGTQLMRRAEIYGLQRRCKTALLFVDEANPRAHRFYLKHGYQTSNWVDAFRCYELRKQLTSPPTHDLTR